MSDEERKLRSGRARETVSLPFLLLPRTPSSSLPSLPCADAQGCNSTHLDNARKFRMKFTVADLLSHSEWESRSDLLSHSGRKGATREHENRPSDASPCGDWRRSACDAPRLRRASQALRRHPSGCIARRTRNAGSAGGTKNLAHMMAYSSLYSRIKERLLVVALMVAYCSLSSRIKREAVSAARRDKRDNRDGRDWRDWRRKEV